MSTTKKPFHYIVTSDAVDYAPTHIYAGSQEEAVKLFIGGENPYGYDEESFEDYDIFIVLSSSITSFRIEEVEVQKHYAIKKEGKGV